MGSCCADSLTFCPVLYSDASSLRRYTFSEVRTTSQRFGAGLQSRFGWETGDVLALFTPNDVDIAPITFGTIWAGGVVSPFNNLYKAPELAAQLQSSGAKLLVTHPSCVAVAQEAARLAGLSNQCILLLGPVHPTLEFPHFSTINSSAKPGRKPAIDPKKDLAFLVYSSGTTGIPKGVMLSHENIVANVLQTHTIESDMTHWNRDRLIGFLPMFHIYGE